MRILLPIAICTVIFVTAANLIYLFSRPSSPALLFPLDSLMAFTLNGTSVGVIFLKEKDEDEDELIGGEV